MRKQIILLTLAAILCIAYTHDVAAQATLESHNLVERRIKKSQGHTIHKPLYKLRKLAHKPRRIGHAVGRVRKFSVYSGKLYFNVWSRVSGGRWIRRKINKKSVAGAKLNKLTKGNRKCIFTVKRKAGKLTRVCRKKYSGRVVLRSVRLTKKLAAVIKSIAGESKSFKYYLRRLHVPNGKRLIKGRWALHRRKRAIVLVSRGKTYKRVVRLKKGSKLSLLLARHLGKVPKGGVVKIRGNGKHLHVLRIKKNGLLSRKKVKVSKKLRKLLKVLSRKPRTRIPRRARFVRRGKCWHVYRVTLSGKYKKFRSVCGHRGRRIVATLLGPGLKTAFIRLKGTKLHLKTLTKDGTVLRKRLSILKKAHLRKIKKLTRRSHSRRTKLFKAGKRHIHKRGPRIHRYVWRTVHLRRGRKHRIFAIVKGRAGKAALYRFKKHGPHQHRLNKLYGKIHKGVAVKVIGRGRKYKVIRTCGQKLTAKKHRLTPRKRLYIRAIIAKRHVLITKKITIHNGKKRAHVFTHIRNRYHKVATLKKAHRKGVLRRIVGKRLARKARKVTIKRIGRKFKIVITTKKGKKKVVVKKLTNQLYRGLRAALNYNGVRKLKKLAAGYKFINHVKKTNLRRLLKKRVLLRRQGKHIYVIHRRAHKIIAQRLRAKSALGHRLRKRLHRLGHGVSIVVQRARGKKGRRSLKVHIFKRGGYHDSIRRKLGRKLARGLKAVLKKRKAVSYDHIRITHKKGCVRLQKKALGKFVHFKKICGRRNKLRLVKLLGARPRKAHVIQKTHKLIVWGVNKHGKRFKAIRRINRRVHRLLEKTLYKWRPIRFGLSPGGRTKKAVLKGKTTLRKSRTHIYGTQRRKGKSIIFRIRRGTPFAKGIRRNFGKIPKKGKLTLIGLGGKVKVVRKGRHGRKSKTVRASRAVRRLLRKLASQIGYVVGSIRFRRVGRRYKLYRKNKKGHLKLASILSGKRARKFKHFVGCRLKKGIIYVRGRKAIIRGRTRKGKYVRKVRKAKASIIFLGGRKLKLRRHRIRVYKVGIFLYTFVYDSYGNRVFHRIRRTSKFGKKLVRGFNLRHYKNVIQGKQSKAKGTIVLKSYHGHVWSKKRVKLNKTRARLLRRLFRKRGILIPQLTKFKRGKRSIRLTKKKHGKHRVFKKICKRSAKKHLKILKGLKSGTIRVVGKHIVVIGKNKYGNVIHRKRLLRRRTIARLFGRLRTRSKHSKKTKKSLRRKAGIPSRKVRRLLRRIAKLKRRIAKAKKLRRKRLLKRLLKRLRILRKKCKGIKAIAGKLRSLRAKKARKPKKCCKGSKKSKLRKVLKRLRRALRKARAAKKAKKVRKIKQAIRRLLKRLLRGRKGKKHGKSRKGLKIRRALKKLRRALRRARAAKKAKKVRKIKKAIRKLLKRLRGRKGKKHGKSRKGLKIRRALKKLRRALRKARAAKKAKKVRKIKKAIRRLLKRLRGRKGKKHGKSRKGLKVRRALKKLRRALRRARAAKKAKKVRKIKKAIRRLLKRLRGRKGKSSKAKRVRRAIRKLRRAIKKARRAHKPKTVKRLKKLLRRLVKRLKRLSKH